MAGSRNTPPSSTCRRSNGARLRGLAALLLLTVTLAGCGGGPAGDSATPGADAQANGSPTSQDLPPPEEALRNYVQNRLLQGFVPNCDDAERPDDVAKQCATFLGRRGDLVAYGLGPTFSEYTRILILKPAGGDWTLVRLETLDPDQPSLPGIPWPIEAGADLVVAGAAPDCLKVREGPGLSAQELGCLEDGTAVTVVAGPVVQDEIEWWQLEAQGWAAGTYLRYPDEAPTPEGETG